VRNISFETEICRQDIVQKIAQGTYLGRGAAAGYGKQAWTVEGGARARRSGRHRCSALSSQSRAIHVSPSCPTLYICPQLLLHVVQKYCLVFFSRSAPWPYPSFFSKKSSMSGYHPSSFLKKDG